MGNQICSAPESSISMAYKNKNASAAVVETQQCLKSTGSQNIQDAVQQMDECSPSSRFDIKFLNTTIRASDIKNTNIQSTNSIKNQYAKFFNPFIPKTEDQIRKSLLQWSVNHLKISQKDNLIGTAKPLRNTSKLVAIKSYANFMAITASKHLDLKISGQNFYKIRHQSITPFYEINKKIGEGSFGSVYKGKCLKTGELRAIKILKKKIMNQKDQKSLLAQINILKKMDHINIIKLYDVFYYKNFFYVITEYCEGGSLLQALQNRQIQSQKDVAILMKQIVSAVCYMHQKKIAHRDLKLDNIVLVNQLNNSSKSKISVKLIDFGLAEQVQHQYRNKTGLVGTVSYMAPEIFSGFFSCHSDVWSCGIILCMLLKGYNPFKKSKQSQTIRAIQKQILDFRMSEWSKVSTKAKSLLVQMLEKKPQKRIMIDQVLNHQWLKSFTKQITQSAAQYKSELVVNNFNNYHRGSNFICYIKNFLISRQLTQAERQEMAIIFQKIDTDSSGVIEKEELIELYSLVAGSTNEQIQRLIQKIDQNKSGRIDFQQFLLCMTKDEIMHNKKYINQAFQFFDEDRTGYIEKKELFDCLEGCQEQQVVKILKQADFNGDGMISREEFSNYLMNITL